MAKYDLTGSLEKEFTFVIGEYEYSFRKPTVREMREVAKQFSALDKIEDDEEKMEKSDESMQMLYEFVSPVNHTQNLKELLDKQPMDVQVAFNEMIKTELGA